MVIFLFTLSGYIRQKNGGIKMKKISTPKRFIALLLVALLTLTMAPIIQVQASQEGFTATFGAYMDESVNPDVGSWPDLTDFGGQVAFSEGQEATITLTFPAPVAFNGPYAAINTDFPYAELGFAEIISLSVDGVDVPLAAQFINDEADGGAVRLTLGNTWNNDVVVQPVDLSALGEFTTLVVTFIVAGAREFNAYFAAYFDESVNEDLGAWPGAADFDGVTTFFEGQETTLFIDFGTPTAFNGPFAAINTDFPAEEAGFAQITSFLLDGVDVPLAAQFINDEGTDGGIRLTVSNTWNSDIEVQPVDLTILGEFTTLEI